jgi:hypothetical protein
MNDRRAIDVERVAARLAASARERGAFVTGDGRVSEDAAAELLGLQPRTMARKRQNGSGPQWFRIGGPGYRVSYRLSDLAVWLEQHGGTNRSHEPPSSDHEPPSTAMPAVEPEAQPVAPSGIRSTGARADAPTPCETTNHP